MGFVIADEVLARFRGASVEEPPRGVHDEALGASTADAARRVVENSALLGFANEPNALRVRRAWRSSSRHRAWLVRARPGEDTDDARARSTRARRGVRWWRIHDESISFAAEKRVARRHPGGTEIVATTTN
jgi:hypothetical protein